MSIYPRPVFSTLYVMRSRLAMEVPTVRELGRLHFTSQELNALERAEKKRIRDMAFQAIKKTSLPETRVGRNVTEPRIGISENGQMVFNSVISKDFKERGITKVMLYFDAETSRVAVKALKADENLKGFDAADYFAVKAGEKDHQFKLSAIGFLRNTASYDANAWGGQAYDVTVSEKVGLIFMLKTGTPVRKPKVVRMAKAPVAAKIPVEVPAEDDLMEMD